MFFHNYLLYAVTIPNILFLLIVLLRANSYDRRFEKQKKSILSLAVIKALVEIIILGTVLHSHIKEESLFNMSPQGVSVLVTEILDVLYVTLGVYILHKTKEIIRILDHEFYDKQWSSYFRIEHV